MLTHFLYGIHASSMITTTAIDLGGAVPLASTDISGALTAFFAIGPVLGVIALVVALRLAPQVLSALRSLGARR